MKKILLLFYAIGILYINAAFSQCTDIYHGYGQTTSIYAPYNQQMISDSAGNSYVLGTFHQSLQVGTFNLSADTIGIFLCKVSSVGNVLWAKVLVHGDSASASFLQMKLTNNGYLILYGSCNSPSASFDTIYNAFSTGNLFLAKINVTTGQPEKFTNMGNPWSYSHGLDVDDGGNIYISGGYNGTAYFGPYSIYCPATSNTFVVKYNSQLQTVWVRRVATGSGTGNSPWVLGWDKHKHIYVCGQFGYGADFGNGNLLMSDSSINGYLVRYDTTGNIIWARASRTDGQYRLMVVNDTTSITTISQRGYYKPFRMFRYNQNGDTLWNRLLTNDTNTGFTEMKFCNGNFYMLGTYFNAMTLDGHYYSNPGGHSFVASFKDVDGSLLGKKDIELSSQHFDISTSGALHLAGNYISPDTINNQVLPPYTTSAIFYVKLCNAQINVNEINFEELNFILYPNPAHNTFIISFNALSSIVNGHLQIFDVMGRQVHQQALNSQSTIIDKQFSPGIYFVKVQVGEKVLAEKLVVE
jgi:hypothetical protein